MSVASVLLPDTRSQLSFDGLDAVQAMIKDSLRQTSLAPMIAELSGAIGGGKMLRARLALKVGSATGAPRDTLRRAAAAVEMVHAASLLHDDVIDGGLLRRGAPAFWARKGISGAILLGDLLVCKAMQLLDGKEHGRLNVLLVRLAGEMCDAEAEQELAPDADGKAPGFAQASPAGPGPAGPAAPRQAKARVAECGASPLRRSALGETSQCEFSEASWAKSVAIARRKTGSLFAFAAAAAAGSDGKRAEALLEAGYRIGTAYQLADDILDARGIPVGDGKELGKDALKEKLTAASAAGGTAAPVRRQISNLYADSSRLLAAWPSVREAWDEYVQNELGPVVKLFIGEGINGHVLAHGFTGNE